MIKLVVLSYLSTHSLNDTRRLRKSWIQRTSVRVPIDTGDISGLLSASIDETRRKAYSLRISCKATVELRSGVVQYGKSVDGHWKRRGDNWRGDMAGGMEMGRSDDTRGECYS